MTRYIDVRQRYIDTRLISGRSFGGGKDGGSNSGNTGEEAPNTLKSKQTAAIVDLLSEGPIKGVVGLTKGVYFDSVEVQRADGGFNYMNANIQFRNGTQAQAPMNGFPSEEGEVGVGVQVKKGLPGPQTRSIVNTDVDRCRFTVSVPQLQSVNKDNGNISGTKVQLALWINNNSGGFANVTNITIEGKTTSNYQRAVTVTLPRPGPWDIRVERLTDDSTSEYLSNDTFWDSYTEIIDDKVNYANSALVGIIIDAEQFRAIPKRSYDTEGLLIRYPNNMDPDTGTYTGTWDGTFAFGWCNNPAWVLYDLIVNGRYGIGDFITVSNVDRWSFYKAGQFCDARVPGKGGALQRRYTCNVQIRDQQEAFDLLQQMASIFRGFTYWSGGQLVLVADQPEDPSDVFTNANVIGGQFTYSGGDIRQRHTQVNVGWNDPTQFGEGRLATVEDPDLVSRYGLQQVQEQAYGCTNESQAVRAGKWTLFSEAYEAEQIHFTAGLQAGFLRPGSIVKVMDANVAGRRRGGRVVAPTDAQRIYFDAPVTASFGVVYVLSVVTVNGDVATVETKNATPEFAPVGGQVDHMILTGGETFSRAPRPDSVFVVTHPTLEATLWRVLSVKQNDQDKYDIEGVRHYPQKWDYVEKNHAFADPDVTDIVAKPPAVTNAKVIEYILQTSAISLQVMATFSWTSKSPLFDVFWHKVGENWQHQRTDQHALNLPVTDGDYQFQVTPIGTLGIKGPMTQVNQKIIGLTALPGPPLNFRITIVSGVALFEWKAATEIDVIIGGHYELRYSATGGASVQWNSAQTILPSIPGSATSVETSYRKGTWLLRTFDITGRASATWAVVSTVADEVGYTPYYRICEDPAFIGTHNNTTVKMPQEWLTIAISGGLWDDMVDPMDTWHQVDILETPGLPPPAPTHGEYTFFNALSAGGVFSIKLGSDILAFPYSIYSEFIDDRFSYSDTWADWDDLSGQNLSGTVKLQMRTTLTDPAGTPTWSPWFDFVPGEYTFWGAQFKAVLDAPAGENIGVETLCVTGDFRNKFDSNTDVPYSAAVTRVYFNVDFFTLPAVVVTVQLVMAEDRIEIVTKTRDYFDVRITMTVTGGNPVGARTFDWHATGF